MWCYFCVYREVNQIYINVSGSCVFATYCLGMFKQHLEVKKAFLRKLKIGLLCDLAVPLLSIYPPKSKPRTRTDTYTPMFIAALFIIVKR